MRSSWLTQYLISYTLVVIPWWILSLHDVVVTANIPPQVSFSPDHVEKLVVGESQFIQMTLNGTTYSSNSAQAPKLVFHLLDTNVATLTNMEVSSSVLGKKTYGFNLTGEFLGRTSLCVYDEKVSTTLGCLDLSVIRKAGFVDKAFTVSVATLVTIIYINMGAALDQKILKATIKKPIGPAIGFFSQFLFMPLLSYLFAKLLIPRPDLQLGLFITGCSPGGGASNIWTLTMGGNLDLSITMTTVSTFAAFAMMPLWILTLGATIFEDANVQVPYSKIAIFAFSLVVPLAIGMLIQFKLPKVAKFLVKILKPSAFGLIIFIVIFATYTNFYIFRLFTWQIILAGMLLPWCGYLCGGGTAWLLKQHWRDIVAIAVETGVQNTGLAIFALRFSLPQPEADLTTVLPVAVSMMTPVIPCIFICIQRCRGKGFSPSKDIDIREEKENNPNVSLKTMENGSYAETEAPS